MSVGRWKSIRVAHRYVTNSGNTKWKAVQGIICGDKPTSPTRRSSKTVSVQERSEGYVIQNY